MGKYLFGLMTFCLFATQAFGNEKVVLQLKWEHEFQFAGYYAALWQGYYDDVGIDVEIRPISRPDGSTVSAINEVSKSNADFGIGAADILIAKNRGIDLVVLSSIFQRSQTTLFSLSDTPIDSIAQLAKLRIAIIPEDSTRIEIEALFKSQGYNIEDLEFVDAPNTVESLIDHKTDVIVNYDISAYTQAKENGVSLNEFKPSNFGLNFYGDTLFTSHKLTKFNPKLVADFISASQKGWLYALANKQTIAKRITDELPRYLFTYKNSYAYNIAFADLMDSLIEYPEKEIGNINKIRWLTMNERMRSLGVAHSQLDRQAFFFEPPVTEKSVWVSIGGFFVIIALLVVIFIFWFNQKTRLTIVSFLLVVFMVDHLVAKLLQKEYEQNLKLNLSRQLNSISAKFEGNLQTNLSFLTGFAAYISARPDLSYEDFKRYAAEIFKKNPMLINFASAKDLIVNYVYPVKDNEKAIGLNYLNNKAQKEMVLQVAKTGQLLIAGPVNLVQSGIAFIGRAPIFTGDQKNRRLWGIISAPLDANALYERSGATTQDLKLAIQSYDSLGNAGPVFFGDKSIFEDPDSLQSMISVGGGSWLIAATASHAPENSGHNIIIFRLILLLTTLIFCVFVVVHIRQQKEKLRFQDIIVKNQKLLENVGQVAKIGGWKLNRDFEFTRWSKQSSILLGKTPEFIPKNLQQLSEFFADDDFALWKENIEQALSVTTPFELELKLRTKYETDVWLRVIVSMSEDCNANSVTGTMQDVTDKILSANIIERQANYDLLTNLPNRVMFNDRLKNAVARTERQRRKCAILFIDLDRFKPINDNHGHHIGDKLLKEAAIRIRQCIRKSDTVSRLSGDEFGVILTDIEDFLIASTIGDKIHDVLEEAYNIDGKSLYCSGSIGISLYPDDGDDPKGLLQKADQAMYEVKNNGRNGSQFYTKEMQEKSEHRHNLLNKLIIAVAENKITPYYQPIFDLKTMDVVKCESLARWQKNDGSYVPPIEFINLAEESGLINKIDLSMLENSAKLMYDINQCVTNIGLTINVSPRLFHTKDKALENWLERIKILSQQINITVEITERLLMDDFGSAQNVLNTLKEYGVKIAIDDFGTGYSSLSYLIKFPIDIIKIDSSFVDAIGHNTASDTLIETILLMARRLHIEVVAEGIETQMQLDFLCRHGCDFGQGHLIGKPMPPDLFKSFIESKRTTKSCAYS